jgi:hypothetical protein
MQVLDGANTPPPKKKPTEMPESEEKIRKSLKTEEDMKHLKKCNRTSCVMCKCIRNKHKWLPKMPFIPSKMTLDVSHVPVDRADVVAGSWLRCVEGDGTPSLWCVACGHALPGADQVGNILAHQKSKKHISAVVAWVGNETGPTGQLMTRAPAASDFTKAWDLVAKGSAPHQGLEGVGQRWKLRRMLWCIFEAMCRLDREHLAKSVIGLTRDKRHFKLLIKFSAVTPDLEVRHGVLWQIGKCPGSGESLKALTIEALQKFCTKSYGRPNTPEAMNPDTNLMIHIIRATECIRIDSASNEILSCQLMQRHTFRVGDQDIKFEKMVIARDKAHGSRRSMAPRV